jgi:hypothetical protein
VQAADGVTVTLVSSTWRASVFEVRGPDADGVETVRWVTVPRRDVERFTAAAAAGLLALALRDVLDVEGRFVPASFDDGFGVFDTRPDDALILSPERGDKSGRRSNRSERAAPRPRTRQLAMVAGGAGALVVLGLAAMQFVGDDGRSSVSPAAVTTLAAPDTTVPLTSVVVTSTPTSTTSSTSTSTSTTVAELTGPRLVQSDPIEETVAHSVFPGGTTRSFDNEPLVLEVDCTTAPDCLLRILTGLDGQVLELPIVDGRVTESGTLPILSDKCPASHVITVVPDLAFEFEPGAAAPRRVIGWMTASSEVIQSGQTTCLGGYVEWEIDSPLAEP